MRIFEKLDSITSDKATSVAIGLFDGVHLGHQKVISECVKKEGQVPTVFTFSFEEERPKGKANALFIMSEQDKRDKMAALGVENYISLDFCEFRNFTANEFIEIVLKEKLKAKTLFCGDNFKMGKGGSVGISEIKEIAKNNGIEVVIIEPVLCDGEHVSSTLIRKLIEEGNFSRANKFLTSPFSYTYKVVEGRKLGRKIGFPTINMLFPEHYIIPKFGVYRSAVIVDGIRYKGITNIGIKPTVSEENVVTSETHILNYNKILYGHMVRIEIEEFIRPEQKFNSVEELVSAIRRDINDNF